VVAALASIGLGVVLGPEAPLIALGGGVAGWARPSRQARCVCPGHSGGGRGGQLRRHQHVAGIDPAGAFLLMEASGLLATLLLAADALAVMPLAILAVAVAYMASARLTPAPSPAPPAAPNAEEPVQASQTAVQ
jgi:hypothetical protein